MMDSPEETPPSLPRGEQDALWDAVNSGDTGAVARNLEPLVDAPSTDVCQGRGNTPLHVAAALGLSELVGRLIEAGAVVDRSTIGGFGDMVGETPLHFACEGGRTESVRLLLEAGADCNATRYVMRNRGLIQSCLALSCGAGDADSVRLLIEAGADPDGHLPERFATDLLPARPLFTSAVLGHIEIARLLLEAGADPDVYSIIQSGDPEGSLRELVRGRQTPDGTFREYVRDSSDPAAEELRSLLA